MSSEPILTADHVCKTFRAYRRKDDRVREFFTRRQLHQRIDAVRDVSFELRPAESLALIGGNGAGKTTLLQILGGVLAPSTGEVTIRGKYSAVFGLGGVFDPESPGRENVRMAGLALGLRGPALARHVEEAVAFADLGDQIDLPVRTYSSGMVARVAFSAAFRADSTLLLLDEVLSVGDARFAAKCEAKIRGFTERGMSLVLATHNRTAVRELCDRALYLERGQVKAFGPTAEVLAQYDADTQS